jgi:hypothetical protein
MPPPPDGKTPNGKNAIEELHDAGRDVSPHRRARAKRGTMKRSRARRPIKTRLQNTGCIAGCSSANSVRFRKEMRLTKPCSEKW